MKEEKVIRRIEKATEEIDKGIEESEKINKKIEELEKKEKLSWIEKIYAKRLIKRLKRTIEMIKKNKLHAEKSEEELKQIITKCIMDLEDIFEMKDEEGKELNKENLLRRETNELLEIMEEGTEELRKIVGEEA